MKQRYLRRAARLFGAGALAVGIALVACSDDPTTPVMPTPAPPSQPGQSQTLTITSQGVFPSLAYIDADLPLLIVNNDTVAHRLHLDLEDQPGCAAFDSAGEIPPGESRLTGVITSDAAGCDVHDHMRHGDRRFTAQLVVGEASR
jgi:hypothetical protein